MTLIDEGKFTDVERLIKIGHKRRKILSELSEIDANLPNMIVKNYNNGITAKEIGDLIGVSRQRVHQIMNDLQWKNRMIIERREE